MEENNFLKDFAAHTVRDWEKVAQQELGDKNPWESLSNNKVGVIVKPYYDDSDAVTENEISFNRDVAGWQNIPKVSVSSEINANKAALMHLNAGADGIWFEIQSNQIDFDVLLKNIELPFCMVFFSISNDSTLITESLASFIEKKGWQQEITGAILSESFDENLAQMVGCKKFRANGIIVKENKNVVDEIVDSLLTAVDIVEGLKNRNFSADEAFLSIAFSISVNADFFVSIAKIRALKNLWITLQEAYQIKKPSFAFIQAYSKKWNLESYQPHGNMLKQTTAAMAAAIAGCEVITVEPEEMESPMMQRIARNVPSMLFEESHLSKVNDPLAGSFYIESLTHEIAAQAWKKIQQYS